MSKIIEQFEPITANQLGHYVMTRHYELYGTYANVTKLNRLSYCCYGVVYAATGIRLTDENLEAWKYGPLFSSILSTYAKCDNEYEYVKLLDGYVPSFIDNQYNYVAQYIDEAIKCFGQFKCVELSNWTKTKGSPWDIASNGGKLLRQQISPNLIKKYFEQYIKYD